MWLKVLRQNLSQLARRAKGSASIEQKNGNGNTKGNKTNNNGVEVNRNDQEQNGPIGDIKNQAKKKPVVPGSGPLLHQAEVSSSQVDFFKMLDEKIENGPDYDESLDAAATVERVSGLLRRWELASVTWSSGSELNGSPSNLRGRCSSLNNSRQSLSAKDREGMRNIIGGRPESAPIFVRNANRVDGLQEAHSPSPKMPRHVLESISQSPTQSQKNTPPSGSSPTCIRYGEYNAGNQSPVNLTSKIGNKMQYHHQTGNNQVYKAPTNGEFITPHQLYREQYLQQTGIISVPNQFSPGSPGANVTRNSPYVKQFQLNTPEHFGSPRKRGFNTAQMT
ncbi:uncharacterized protein LOC105684799 isoform X2 [Athalia rosae]|uniref:uncharacterized protein LOC105684799 isoform X2 n=1 Tax=Athalia rosae TaxID=37344 RepID=UPI000624F596|nr:uncharacterized protein LOC105684799 isoform X2 [Athalia rosae]